MDKEKYVGNSKIKEKPTKPLKFKLSERIKALFADLQNQIDSFNEHGLSVSNRFGNDRHIGVSQYALTVALNRIWQKFSEITGEVTQGISMTVSPKYWIGDGNCDVTMEAFAIDTIGLFEELAFYAIDANAQKTLIGKINEPTDHFFCGTVINDTTIIKCEAQILGMPYEAQETITRYDSLWLGAGNSYSDVMTNANLIPVERGAYDRAVADGEHIIVVLGESLASWFIRADINGIEIAMARSTVTIGDVNYVVFTSEDTYQAGTFNIDING